MEIKMMSLNTQQVNNVIKMKLNITQENHKLRYPIKSPMEFIIGPRGIFTGISTNINNKAPESK